MISQNDYEILEGLIQPPEQIADLSTLPDGYLDAATTDLHTSLIALQAFACENANKRGGAAPVKEIPLFAFYHLEESQRFSNLLDDTAREKDRFVGDVNMLSQQLIHHVMQRTGMCENSDQRTSYTFDDSGYYMARDYYHYHLQPGSGANESFQRMHFQKISIFNNGVLIREIWSGYAVQKWN